MTNTEHTNPLPTIAEMASARLITCSEQGCRMQFFIVPAREFSTLCMDHADIASTEVGR